MAKDKMKYNDGQEFMFDLYHEYGLLKAFRIAKEYLAINKNADKEERVFCDQIELAMWKLDQI